MLPTMKLVFIYCILLLVLVARTAASDSCLLYSSVDTDGYW
jgi:hypothetical protein